jgi:plasmid stabilization system protein ParE
MRLRWTVPAAEDLEGIKNYLEKHYSHFAEPTVRTIYERIRSLTGRHRTGVGPATAAAQENCRYRRSLTLWYTR